MTNDPEVIQIVNRKLKKKRSESSNQFCKQTKSQKSLWTTDTHFVHKNTQHPPQIIMDAAVVTFVAGSLEAGGLPGSLEIPEVLK